MPVLHGYKPTRRFNRFDSITIDQIDQSTVFLFGNRNVGNMRLCNLHVPGMLSYDPDLTAQIEHWYARTDVLPESLSERARASLHRFASHAVVTLVIGDQPHQGFQDRVLADLLEESPWEPASVAEANATPEEAEALRARIAARITEGNRPAIVPVRHGVCVRLLATAGYTDRLYQDLDGVPLTLRIHLEGIATRDNC